MAGLAIHLDLGDLGDDGLAAEGVGDAAAGQDVAGAARASATDAASQPYASAAALTTAIERARLKPLSSRGAGGQQLQRNSTGSAFAAAASSSMNDSEANVDLRAVRDRAGCRCAAASPRPAAG